MINLYIALMLYHTICAVAARERRHSQYNGLPRLLWLAPFVGERWFKTIVEPLIVAGLAYAVDRLDHGIAIFMFLGALSMVFEDAAISMRRRRQVRELIDAEIGNDLLMNELESTEGKYERFQ